MAVLGAELAGIWRAVLVVLVVDFWLVKGADFARVERGALGLNLQGFLRLIMGLF